MINEHLPPWMLEWTGLLIPAAKVLGILVMAWLMQRMLRRLTARLCRRYGLPSAVAFAARRTTGFLIGASATLWILDVFGVSGTVLWTAFTSFAAVGAVAFFAAWSVLSNIFCTFLIFITRPFRIDDVVELLENGEKPGLKGRVTDINLVYTTLMESGTARDGTLLQIPNSLFFQRTLRRWRGTAIPALPEKLPGKESSSMEKSP